MSDAVYRGNKHIAEYFECCWKTAWGKILSHIKDSKIIRRAPVSGAWVFNASAFERKYGSVSQFLEQQAKKSPQPVGRGR